MDLDDLPGLSSDSEDEAAAAEHSKLTWTCAKQPSLATSSRQAAAKFHDEALDRTIENTVSSMIRQEYRQPWDSFFADLLSLRIPNMAIESVKLPKSSSSFSGVWPTIPEPAQVTLQRNTGALLSSAVRRLHATPWPEQQAASRERALRQGRLVVEENYSKTSLGENLHKMAIAARTDAEMAVVISDTFADRKSSTLSKRAGCILKYLLWHRQNYGTSGLPLSEDHCYLYVKSLPSPTSGKSFLSAVRFCHFVLQMEGAQAVLDSGRIRGATFQLFVQKKPLKQRRPFRIIELNAIEAIAKSSKCPYDRYFSHFILLQTYARARFNDIARETQLIVDLVEDGSGYLEIQVRNAKTQRSAEAKTTFLPTVAPAVGVTQFRWAVSFLEERKAQGLESCCLMPTPAIQGGWHDSPLEISSANKWLKDLLISAGLDWELDLIGTHTRAKCLDLAGARSTASTFRPGLS